MNITQTFYDNLASQYDKLFLDWQSATHEQAVILNRLFQENGFDKTANILDCACGIGTQAIGLAALGYSVTASDISDGEIVEAKVRAENNQVKIRFEHADFCALSETFSEPFDIVICMDNALPHMLSKSALEAAVKSITNQIAAGGMFVASIRDYDALLVDKPPYSPPYIHKTAKGQRVSFQTWEWNGEETTPQHVFQSRSLDKTVKIYDNMDVTIDRPQITLWEIGEEANRQILLKDSTGEYYELERNA